MIKIAICDDDVTSLGVVYDLLNELDCLDGVANEVSKFSSSKELLELLNAGETFDLFFLDVVMPEIDGISLGGYIAENLGKAKIVYFSSTREFAVESYMVRAFYYLLKPIKKAEFIKVATNVLKVISSEKVAPIFVAVDTIEGKVAVQLDKIEYCLLENRRVKYFLSDGLNIESKVIRSSFDESVADIIASKKFFKCSSHYIINIEKVRIIEADKVIMKSGEVFKVSRVFKNELNRAYFNYYFDNFGGRVHHE